MKVLLVGNGGREHAIARALVRTSTPEHPVQLVVQAGNPALEQLGRSLTMDPLDPKDVVRRATSENVDLVVVGPEAPLVAGVAETIRLHIATGEWPLPDGDALTKGRQLGIDFERFLERSQLRNSEVIKVGDFHVISRSATAPLSVRDRHTGIESTLTLSMEQAADGHWQITGIANYQQYLDAIAPRQNRDIADYIAATRDIVAAGNDELAALKARFRAITKNAGGKLEGASASELTSLISGEIIPALKERQRKLDTVSIPLGAQYLANLRHTSTELAIAAWQHYQRAVETQSVNEFNTAETLKKQEIETDLRITDIIRHNVVSQSLPNIP